MPVPVDRAIRYASGARLRFERAAQGPLLDAAIRRYVPGEGWLAELRTAPVQVLDVQSDGCALSLKAHDYDARVSLARAADGTLTLAVSVEGAGRPRWACERANLTAMLGGKRDVYLAQCTETGPVPVLRLRYADDGTRISLLGPAIAQCVDPALRAFVPDEIMLGTLAPEAANGAVN